MPNTSYAAEDISGKKQNLKKCPKKEEILNSKFCSTGRALFRSPRLVTRLSGLNINNHNSMISFLKKLTMFKFSDMKI